MRLQSVVNKNKVTEQRSLCYGSEFQLACKTKGPHSGVVPPYLNLRLFCIQDGLPGHASRCRWGLVEGPGNLGDLNQILENRDQIQRANIELIQDLVHVHSRPHFSIHCLFEPACVGSCS